MKTLLIEIVQLFRREKIYLVFLTIIILFYAFVFLTHHKPVKNELPKKPQEKVQSAQALWHSMPENPEVIQKRLAKHPLLFWAVQIFTFFFIGAFTLGIWFGFLDLRRLFLKQEVIPSSGQFPFISWGISEIIKIILLFFLVGIDINLVLAIVKVLFGIKFDPSFLILIQTIVLDVAIVFLMAWVIRKNGGQLKDLFGFRFSKIPVREIWLGIRTYFVILPVFAGILIFLVVVANLFTYEPPPHPLVEILMKEKTISPWMMAFSLLAACVIGPVVEEIFFRGFLYPALRKYFGIGWTLFITSAFFALVHENAFSFVPIFFLGLVLSYLYEKRNNLLSCISLHVLHNTAFITYFFLMKDVLNITGKG